MAQLINATMRQKLNDAEAISAPQYPGFLRGLSHLRLQQQATSKLILQIFLAIMLACGLFVYSQGNLKHVIPMCPWSIVGTMMLLAGSGMLDRKVIPPGAEFMSDKQLAKVFEGYMFRLGWWDNAGAEVDSSVARRRFGIDVGKTGDDEKA